jgi:hypothetical protein
MKLRNREKIINLGEISIIKLRPLKLDKNPYMKENMDYYNKRREQRIEAKPPYIGCTSRNVQSVGNPYIMGNLWNCITSFHRNSKENIASTTYYLYIKFVISRLVMGIET